MDTFSKLIQNRIFVSIIVIIDYLFAMLVVWLIYDKILSSIWDLPKITYFQMWLIKTVLGYLANTIKITDFENKVDYYVDRWTNLAEDFEDNK